MSLLKNKNETVVSDYSLEDVFTTFVDDVNLEIQKLMSERLWDIFLDFIQNKNNLFEEIENELIDQNVDKKIVDHIFEKINSIIFTDCNNENDNE